MGHWIPLDVTLCDPRVTSVTGIRGDSHAEDHLCGF